VFTRVRVDEKADEYRSSLWLVDVATSAARPLTSGERDTQPRWSPDGKRIAFVRASEPKKPGQIFVLPMDGGEAIALTKLEGGTADPAWSRCCASRSRAVTIPSSTSRSARNRRTSPAAS
jgi:dipeptidyl aminopeptidase/acylaminoacyl peptidase